MKVLTGVNPDGTGVYEMVKLGTNKWLTLSYDVDMLIKNYDVIFNAGNASDGGLVLIATPNKTENNSDWNALDYNNKFYIGEIFYANKDFENKEKYGGFDRVNAVSSTDNIVSRIYSAWNGNYYDFGIAGDYTRVYMKSSVPTENIADKASAIATIVEITLVAAVSPWCEAIELTTTSFSLYFLAISTPISTWLPSIS